MGGGFWGRQRHWLRSTYRQKNGLYQFLKKMTILQVIDECLSSCGILVRYHTYIVTERGVNRCKLPGPGGPEEGKGPEYVTCVFLVFFRRHALAGAGARNKLFYRARNPFSSAVGKYSQEVPSKTVSRAKGWGTLPHTTLRVYLNVLPPTPVSHKRPVSFRHKGEGHPRTGHEGPEGENRYSSTLSLTSALDGVGWSTPRPDHFTPGK